MMRAIVLGFVGLVGLVGTAVAGRRFPHPTELATDCSDSVAATAHTIFWATKSALMARDLPAGQPREVAHVENLREIVAAGDTVWFASLAGIERVDADGKHRTMMVDHHIARGLAVDADELYWIEDMPSSIWAIGRLGGEPRKLGQSPRELGDIAISGDRVYVTPDTGGVHSISKAGGELESEAEVTLLSGVGRMAASGSRVVWTNGSEGTVDLISKRQDTVLFEDATSSTEEVGVAPDGRIVFVRDTLRIGTELLVQRAGTGKPRPYPRRTLAPMAETTGATRLTKLSDQKRTNVRALVVMGTDVFWSEDDYGTCRLRAISLP
jgi:hypothetical protein